MITNTSRGTIIRTGTATYFSPTVVSEVIAEFKTLTNAVEKFASAVETITDESSEKHRPEKVRKAARDLIAPFKAAQKASISYDETLQLNLAKYETLPPVVDQSIEQAWRDEFRALDFPANLKVLRDWPIEAVIAVLRLGATVLELKAEHFEIGMERVRVYNLINGTALRSQFILKPTLDDPIARGTDHKAVEEYATEAQKVWKSRREVVEAARKQLQNTCTVVAIAADMQVLAAFDFLTDAE